MNPLSALTHYRRHKRSPLLQIALVSLMTLGVCVMVRLPDTIVETAYNAERYVTRVSFVSVTDSSLDPETVAQIRAFPDVAHVLQETSLQAMLTFSIGEYRLLGVSAAAVPVLMEACDLRLSKLAKAVGILLFAIAESVVAVVAAIALACLSHIFIVQRRREFSILHAVGHSRWWLVLRTAKESLLIVGTAWLMGAALCGICLMMMQIVVYAPKGLSLNFLNPVPWMLTLPIPLAVVAVGTGTVAWTLSKLDPVATVERR